MIFLYLFKLKFHILNLLFISFLLFRSGMIDLKWGGVTRLVFCRVTVFKLFVSVFNEVFLLTEFSAQVFFSTLWVRKSVLFIYLFIYFARLSRSLSSLFLSPFIPLICSEDCVNQLRDSFLLFRIFFFIGSTWLRNKSTQCALNLFTMFCFSLFYTIPLYTVIIIYINIQYIASSF